MIILFLFFLWEIWVSNSSLVLDLGVKESPLSGSPTIPLFVPLSWLACGGSISSSITVFCFGIEFLPHSALEFRKLSKSPYSINNASVIWHSVALL